MVDDRLASHVLRHVLCAPKNKFAFLFPAGPGANCAYRVTQFSCRSSREPKAGPLARNIRLLFNAAVGTLATQSRHSPP